MILLFCRQNDLFLLLPTQTINKTGLNPIQHGGGADSALLQIVFFMTSVRDAAEPRNLVTFPKI